MSEFMGKHDYEILDAQSGIGGNAEYALDDLRIAVASMYPDSERAEIPISELAHKAQWFRHYANNYADAIEALISQRISGEI